MEPAAATPCPTPFSPYEPCAPIAPATLAFVLCIEATAIEAQALRLCQSIRAHCGAYATAPIYAICPRPRHAPSPRTRARLAELQVVYVEEDLNQTGSPYLPINRIVAASWAERNIAREYLLVLDSDTLFLAPPSFRAADVGVRPVDTKGATSCGPDDPLDTYWRAMVTLADLDIEQLPFVTATMTGERIRASFNGGFTIVRTRCGVLQATERIFFASLARDLRPLRGQGLNIRASTGSVGSAASEFWGSSQAALSIAICARARSVIIYPEGYNIPLHMLSQVPPAHALAKFTPAILAHYHWLGDVEHRPTLRRMLTALGRPDVAIDWD